MLFFTEKQHLLAVGDNAGTLHILEIPWSLRQPTPNEVSHPQPSPQASPLNPNIFVVCLGSIGHQKQA